MVIFMDMLMTSITKMTPSNLEANLTEASDVIVTKWCYVASETLIIITLAPNHYVN